MFVLLAFGDNVARLFLPEFATKRKRRLPWRIIKQLRLRQLASNHGGGGWEAG